MLQFFLLVLSSLSYTEYKCTKDPTTCSPAEGKKLSITSAINSYAGLCNCDYKDVEISVDVQSVESNLLNGAKINTVLFNGVTGISSNAFANTEITTVDLSDADPTLTISDAAFYNAKIDELILAPTINIQSGDYAFQNCQVIKELDLSNFVSSNGESVFYGATIEKISRLNKDTKEVPSGLFGHSIINTLNLKDFTDITKISSHAFDTATINPATQTFPDTLTEIGNSAFINSNLKSITFSTKQNDLSIGTSAFQDLISLVDATIHAKTINSNAFSGCINLVAKSISVAASGNIFGNAFKDCYKLGCGLTIAKPSSLISSIQSSAFENSGLTSINLPTMKTIASGAFKNCTQLAGGGVLNCDTIGANAFEDDERLALTSITANTIGSSAFKNCRMLDASITINIQQNSGSLPVSVISYSAFESCDKLKELTFNGPKDLDDPTIFKTEIDPYTISIGYKAFYKSGLQGSLIIPYTLTEINDYAFSYCTKLESVTIEGVYHLKKVIKDYAFYHSSIAGPLSLPNTVNEVGSYAFSFTGITELTVFGSNRETIITKRGCINMDYENDQCLEYGDVKDEEKSWTATKISDNAFYECRELTKLNLEGNDIIFDVTSFRECPIKDLSITGNIKNIPDGAFYGMTSITSSIIMPDSVETIGSSAFEGCNKLKSVTFNENSKLRSIAPRAFYGCSKLESTNIPKKVENLNGYTYYGCSELKSIILPPNLKSIGNCEFYECQNLNCKLPIPDELTSIGNKAFYKCEKLNGPLEFPDSTTTIGDEAFYECSGLSGDLSFGRQIKSIGKEAFRGCTSLAGSLKFPEYLYNDEGGVLSIDKRAFYEGKFTQTLTLPQKVKFVGEEAFRGCKGFTGELIIPEGAVFESGAINTFRDCSGFTSLKIKDLSSIEKGTFQDCTELANEIPLETVTSIGENAFSGCSKLTGPLHLKDTTVEDYAFYNCVGLNGELICDNALTNIGKYAFYGCSGLTGQLDCTGMTKVGRYAFYGCSGLTGSINFTSSLENIDEYAFAGCSGLSDTLTFKVNNLIIRYGAFKECTGFKDGTLRFIMDSGREETDGGLYYTYPYFLSVDTDAFLDTKFKNIYYLGRFAPDCGYDSGLSKAKNIYTSANFANKTFCGKTVKGKGGLSGGAIAGIVIAVVVVVAVIVFLVIYFLKKKGKDNSEGEVEMNNEP